MQDRTLKPQTMNTKRTLATSALIVLATLAAVGCERREDTASQNPNNEPTLGQKVDQAVADGRTAAQDAGTAIENRAEQAGNAMERGAEQTAQAFDDAKITASVKAELIKDESLQATAINVDTAQGVVTLRGEVPSRTAKERAQTLAKQVTGVASVTNDLTVADVRTSSSGLKD